MRNSMAALLRSSALRQVQVVHILGMSILLHHLPVAPPSGGEVEMSLLGKQAQPRPEVEMVALKPHVKSPRSRDSAHHHLQGELEPIELKTLGDGDEELQTLGCARVEGDGGSGSK